MTTPEPAPATGQDTDPAEPQQPAEAPKDDQPTDDAAATIARLERDLKEARAEAGKSRVNAKAKAAEDAKAELAQQIGKALGLVKDGDDAPDPAELPKQLAAEREGHRKALLKVAVYETAPDAGADAKALLDSVTFIESMENVDVHDAKAVAKAIKETLEKNPRYKANGQAPAPRGGAEPTGRPGRTAQPANLTEAIAARLAEQGS